MLSRVNRPKSKGLRIPVKMPADGSKYIYYVGTKIPTFGHLSSSNAILSSNIS